MGWIGETIDGQPVTDWPAINKACAKHKRFVVDVHKYDEEREITNQQMAYLHTVVYPTVAKSMHCSLWEAEFQCKTGPGKQWLVKRIGDLRFVLSKTGMSVKDCTQWIENIFDWGDRNGIFIPPPDKEWWKRRIEPEQGDSLRT
ncbi:MAG TPA: hypothetical protein PLF11_15580 [Bacillota bacterium]|nr:hypothetical protein [Bacillota bacterium]